ncbi:SRPBCC family protein [Croceiramulus getboli]|nr:SRPBCC family protein [Flavobacteriaceae bacterium YJPT1-3]
MQLESPQKNIQKSQEEVYYFLTDVKNFEQLMPETISKFEVLAENRFVFALKGMPEIILDLKDATPHQQVIYGAASDKIPFTLMAEIEAVGTQESQVQMHFEGEFNAMMSMMIKAPIKKFLETLVTNLQGI